MSGLVVVGAQWGDEGKGKIVDLLASEAQVVARFQGGPNAGHTLVVGGDRVVLHHVPSGVLFPTTRNVIGAGAIVDPISCLEEIRGLDAKGLLGAPGRLIIDRRCHIILPLHRHLDKVREQAAGSSRIGTTGRGIGPCCEDVVARRGIRFLDLDDLDAVRNRLRRNLREKDAVFRALGAEPLSEDEILEPTLEAIEALKPFFGDAREVVYQAMTAGQRVLFEGAQGTLLDPRHGTYPFVTSTPCVAGAATTGVGVGPGSLGGVLGVSKAYTTRVGEGPFPTELHGEEGERLRQAGGEFGATTGRPRRCGWLDLPLLRYAVQVNGVTGLALTKLDVLSGMGNLKICVAYEYAGKRYDSWPAHAPMEALTPIFETVPGWEEDISECKARDELPAAALTYVEGIEAALNVPASLIAVGAERDATIRCRSPWRDAEG